MGARQAPTSAFEAHAFPLKKDNAARASPRRVMMQERDEKLIS
jgi:hypothetical protein